MKSNERWCQEAQSWELAWFITRSLFSETLFCSMSLRSWKQMTSTKLRKWWNLNLERKISKHYSFQAKSLAHLLTLKVRLKVRKKWEIQWDLLKVHFQWCFTQILMSLILKFFLQLSEITKNWNRFQGLKK